MNNRIHSAGHGAMCILACIALTSCGFSNPGQGTQSLRLAPCGAEGSVFADIPFAQWQEHYHTAVSKAVEAHMATMNNTTALPLQCSSATYGELVPASDALKSIASSLPAYKDTQKASSVSEMDLAPVLLEFLRVYECSLKEQERYAALRVSAETDKPLEIGEFAQRTEEQQALIQDELSIARPTLERTLTLVGGYDRLRPLALDMECIKRASLDLRNVMGLAADASSCLPRIWDAHGSLRDLPDSAAP